MKAMKGKFLRKLKSIKPIGYLKQDRILHVNASDGFVEFFPKFPNVKPEPQIVCKETEHEKIKKTSEIAQEPDVIDVSELMKDLEEEEDVEAEEMDFDDDDDDKENIGPQEKAKDSVFFKDNVENSRKVTLENCRKGPLSEINASPFRRPDLNSGSLFDPNLLAAFEQAMKEHVTVSEAERNARIEQENLRRQSIEKAERSSEPETEDVGMYKEETERNPKFERGNLEKNREEEAELKLRIEPKNLEKSTEKTQENAKREQENLEESNETEPPYKIPRIDTDDDDNNNDPLFAFEEKCPPGGDGTVIIYTTTLRGVRKTFEGCNKIRFLLESFRVVFFERDVSMHAQYKEELWEILGGKAVPPKLFIKGRYIGGAEEVLGLHEQGKLKLLFEGVPIDRTNEPCEGCGGVRFVLCFKCRGSHKVVDDGGMWSPCPECNENGLIICPYCG